MRLVALASLVLALGCVAGEPIDTVGSAESPIINGARERGYDEVVGVVLVNGGGSIVGSCSGTVIGRRYVLTAKHCVYNTDTGAEISPSRLRVIVGDELFDGSGDVYSVADWESTPGAYSDDDLTEGNDVAVIRTSNDISAPVRELARSTARIGMPIEIVGFGRTNPRSGRSGTKYRGTTEVGEVYLQVFQTMGMSRTCQGDSGGPAFDPVGRVIGVTSFGVDEQCREDMSFYSEIRHHLGWIEDFMGAEPPCTAMAQRCNRADDNCDGVVDEGCGVAGAGCVDDDECESGVCAGSGAVGLVCVDRCEPDVVGECAEGFVCAQIACGTGECVESRANRADGQNCNRDDVCTNGQCFERLDGTRTCARQCFTGSNPCPDGFVCEMNGGCGGCVVPTGDPLPFGTACTDGAQCASGDCHESGICTQACTTHEDCPGFRCDGARCETGLPVSMGGACEDTAECETGLACEDTSGGRICTASCDAGCPAGTTCEGGVCVAPGLPLGEVCTDSGECRSGICAGNCTQICEDASGCPSGFECLAAGAVMGCFRPAEMMEETGGGGCAAGGSGSGVLLMLLVLVALRRRD